jgi:phosphatidylserine decarboxylase
VHEVRYRDRATGEIRVERVAGEKALRFLHEHPRGRKLTDLVLRHAAPNHLYGVFQRWARSKRMIPAFIEATGLDPSEAERPASEYRSLDDFFTRRLRPGARPVDRDPAHLVSPADGRVLVYPRLAGGRMEVKGAKVTLSELLGDAAMAKRYAEGAAAVVRLAPPDYHRFHFPDSGRPGKPRKVGWHLYSVNPIALKAGAPSFRNKRQVTALRSRGFGEVLLLEVGALGVGTIVQTFRPGEVERGDEKGYFRFGGSTVVMILEAGRAEWDPDLVEASAAEMETLVKMGSRIARAPSG